MSICEITDSTDIDMSLKDIQGQIMSPELKRELRNALGGFATGVTVILAKSDDGFHGMTANSFTAVSLSPPLVLVSVANDAKAADAIKSADKFSVNLLSTEQEDLSWHFAGRPNQEGDLQVEWTEAGVPILTGSLGSFECALFKVVEAGDHTLFLGEVISFGSKDSEPLVFFRGQYGHFLSKAS